MFNFLNSTFHSALSRCVLLDKVITEAMMISPKEEWERVNELLEKCNQYAQGQSFSQYSILQSLVDRQMSIGEMIDFFDKYNAARSIKTDCKYYSGNLLLKCAVNPDENCQSCREYY